MTQQGVSEEEEHIQIFGADNRYGRKRAWKHSWEEENKSRFLLLLFQDYKFP